MFLRLIAKVPMNWKKELCANGGVCAACGTKIGTWKPLSLKDQREIRHGENHSITDLKAKDPSLPLKSLLRPMETSTKKRAKKENRSVKGKRVYVTQRSSNKKESEKEQRLFDLSIQQRVKEPPLHQKRQAKEQRKEGSKRTICTRQ
ncbi:hypothetical protein BHE74_00020276 [Ensete ventricosum]|nr:hypothetical protein BHE74_00020276 [Ensete ventricosum]